MYAFESKKKYSPHVEGERENYYIIDIGDTREDWRFVSKAIADRIVELYKKGFTDPYRIQEELPVYLDSKVISDVIEYYGSMRELEKLERVNISELLEILRD